MTEAPPWLTAFAERTPFAEAFRSSAQSSTTGSRLRAELDELPQDEWPARLRRLISDQVSLILRRSVDPDRPLSGYGVDSLGALELRTRIETETGDTDLVHRHHHHHCSRSGGVAQRKSWRSQMPPDAREGPMELDDRTLPLTRGQLDIWLAQQTGRFGTDWQIGLLVKIEGPVQREPLEWAIRRVMKEAEPVRAAFFEQDGRVHQKAIDHPKIDLAYHDLTGSPDPVQEAYGVASTIQRTPMPLTGAAVQVRLVSDATR